MWYPFIMYISVAYDVGPSVNLLPNSFFLLRSLVWNVVESLMTKTTQNLKSPTPFRYRNFQTTFIKSYLPNIFQQYPRVCTNSIIFRFVLNCFLMIFNNLRVGEIMKHTWCTHPYSLQPFPWMARYHGLGDLNMKNRI
jgi:hypothetical protein